MEEDALKTSTDDMAADVRGESAAPAETAQQVPSPDATADGPDITSLSLTASPPPPDSPPFPNPDTVLKRSEPFQFGSRYLLADDDVYAFNAWDHVETDDAFKAWAEEQYERQRAAPVSDFDKSSPHASVSPHPSH